VGGPFLPFSITNDPRWLILLSSPSQTNSALYAAPTESSRANHTWPADNDAPSTSSIRAHPRLIAPKYKWDALTSLIANDPYLASWNATIFANASTNYDAAPQPYTEDGGLSGSGILDPAREIKLRIKNWAYAYKMSSDTRWADRAWTELNVRLPILASRLSCERVVDR
jgi:hypothetical protein